jgi:acyl carrier protein
MEIKENIKNILIKILKVRSEEIQSDVTLYDGLGVDSTEMVEIVIVLEKTFGTKLQPKEINKFSTLDDIEKVIQIKLTNADNRLEPAY